MRSSLELFDWERSQAAYYQKLVREMLTERTLDGVHDSFLIGSYARHTAITPLKDVDIAVVLDRNYRADLLRKGPQACIHAVTVATDDAFDRLRRRPVEQRRSIGIEFLGGALKIEVVPAFLTNCRGILQIADRQAGRWIHTAPQEHARLSTLFHERSGGYLKHVIKMLKAWRKQIRLPLKSFHLEVMCYDGLAESPQSLSHAICLTLKHLAHAVALPCPDPTPVGADIDSDLLWEDRMLAKRRIEEASYLAEEALQYESDRPVWAHNRWKRIFGSLYPREDFG